MSQDKKEVERLMRLREQQIRARTPGAKQKEIQRRVYARRRKQRKNVTLMDMITEVPYKLQGVMLGALIGVIISIALPMLVEASWTGMVGIAALVFLTIVGFVLGQALDVREELSDL
jgi:VIT1/CCC1 family predicted Fe2+/Mn2+ transporter